MLYSIKGRLYYKKILQYVENKPNGFEQFSFFSKYYKTPINRFGSIPDIIHLNWIEEWIDYPSFFKSIPNTTPIVWTLHDMNPLAGGCHFSSGCENYKCKCENCPQLHESSYFVASDNVNLKSDLLKGKNIHIVSPSKWLAECAKQSCALREFNIHVIPNGIDTSLFVPLSKDCCRETNSLPQDKFLILFVAGNLDNERKGWKYVKEALSLLTELSELVLVTIGDIGVAEKIEGIGQINIGVVKDQNIINQIYSACDLFLMSSIEDNLPNTLLEAFSSGLPALGFNVGGVPDIIEEGHNGYLVELKNTTDFASKIKFLCENRAVCSELSENARATAVERFDIKVSARQYMNLYNAIA